ncbi:MAG TPA: hypothetical protein VMH23_19860 [Bacteroidota bacterium]|nr:hypothetical protein [Bacteroidota bacterium]
MKSVLIVLLVFATVVMLNAQVPQGGGTPKAGAIAAQAKQPSIQRVTTTLGSAHKITYQGVLSYVDSHGKTKIMKKGTYSVRFELYDDAVGGSVQDSHTYSITTDTKGVYTKTLGEDGTDQGNLDASVFDRLLWLQVMVMSGPETHVSYPHIVGSRVQLTAVPYAMLAQKVVNLNVAALVLTGTTGASQGDFTTVPHGLDATKILSVDVEVDIGGGQYIPAGHYIEGGFQIEYWYNSTIVTVNTTLTNSYSILSKPFKITIMYEP